MQQVSITPGSLRKIDASSGQENGFFPVVQVISIKTTANQNVQSALRYRMVISDGESQAQSVLTTNQNELVQDGSICEGCLIRLDEFLQNKVQGKNMIVILNATVMSSAVPILVNPVNASFVPTNAATEQSYKGPSTYNSGGITQPGGYNAGGMQGTSNYNSNTGIRHEVGYGHPAPSYNTGPIQRVSETIYIPISELNPYQNRWTIKARVTAKSDIRRWSNQRGEGHLASVDLLDDMGGEIRGTFFNEAVDKLHSLLQVGQVYSFSGGRLKPANKQYSTIKHEYEITFNNDAEIVPLCDDKRIKTLNLDLKKIASLNHVGVNTVVDLVAVVKHCGDVSTITTKANRELERRNLTIVDDSGAEIAITLWGSHARMSEDILRSNPIIAFKGVRVSDYNSCSLSTLNSTTLSVMPDLPEARDLRMWWSTYGNTGNFSSMTSSGGSSGGGGRSDLYDISQRTTLASIKDKHLGFGEKPDYISIKAFIAFIRHDSDTGPWYTACPAEGCNKKVTAEMDQGFRCEKCARSYSECKRRYILSMSMCDLSGLAWFSVFNDVAEPILNNHTADDLNIWKSTGQEEEFEGVFREACWKQYVMRVRVKAENVNEEQRVKSTVIDAELVDPVKESIALLKAIQEYV